MSPIISIVKYVLLGIVFVVVVAKGYEAVMKIIKKYKKQDDDFEEEL